MLLQYLTLIRSRLLSELFGNLYGRLRLSLSLDNLLKDNTVRKLMWGSCNRSTKFFSPLQDCSGKWRVVWELWHCQKTSSAVVTPVHLIHLFVVLALQEVRQHLIVTPTFVAFGSPIIKVLPSSPDVHHAVHHRRTTQDLTPGPVAPPIRLPQTSLLLRLRHVSPIDVRPDEIQKHGRHLRTGRLVHASFHQQYLPVGYLRQTAGHHRPSTSSSNHNKVVLWQDGSAVVGATARVLEVALGAEEDLEEAHEEHELGAPAGGRERRSRLGNRTVTRHLSERFIMVNSWRRRRKIDWKS